jgi:hypothetical protein
MILPVIAHPKPTKATQTRIPLAKLPVWCHFGGSGFGKIVGLKTCMSMKIEVYIRNGGSDIL